MIRWMLTFWLLFGAMTLFQHWCWFSPCPIPIDTAGTWSTTGSAVSMGRKQR